MSLDGALPASEEVIWRGRPHVGVLPADLLAGAAAGLLTALVLCGGLRFLYGLSWGEALRLGGNCAGIVAVVIALTRAVGAKRPLGVASAFSLALLSTGLMLGRSGWDLLCPGATTVFLGVVLVWRMRQRLATRYTLTSKHGALGEISRYTIVFPHEGRANLHPDRFGSGLADVDFGRADAFLRTRSGETFKVPGRLCRFQRIRDARSLGIALAALHALNEAGAAPPAADPEE